VADEENLMARMTKHGEEAIGRLAQELLEIPLISRSIAAALETRERAVRAQEVAMGALNLPSASDLERLTRRIRNVSQRLEAIEDGLDRIEHRAASVDRGDPAAALSARLDAIEASLQRLEHAGAAQGAQPAPAGAAAAVKNAAAKPAARRAPRKPKSEG
jgi:hypothetical protein